jgi:type IV pilus secretin PilQ/predicted competence protein
MQTPAQTPPQAVFRMKKIILILCLVCIGSLTPPTAGRRIYAQEASDNIRGLLSSQGKVLYGNEPNSILVIDYPENIQRVAEYLDTIDIPPRQVLIEARVVEVKLQKEHALGVNWRAFAKKGYMPIGRLKAGALTTLGSPPAPPQQAISYKPTFYPPAQTTAGQESPFTFSIFDDNINIVVQTLASVLDTNILSAPKVTTVNNREAEIKVIQRLPWAEPTLTEASGTGTGTTTVSVTWKINYEEVGIKLKVTPVINDDGNISLALAPEVSEKTADLILTATQGGTSINYTVPIIDTRNATTKVVIGDGQTLIIGGLIKDKTTKGVSKIPLLGDIPYLGYLFKSKKDTLDKTELLIFVSPKIITPEEVVYMAREEKSLLNKGYLKERQRQQEAALNTQETIKAKNDLLNVELERRQTRRKAIIEDTLLKLQI